MRRLKQDFLEGPNGEVVVVNWFPGKRLDIHFKGCGFAVVTKIFAFPDDKKGNITTIQTRYGEEK